LTSGGDQIFPKGLPVGTVTTVGKGKDLFLSINIKPAANLSKLEEVLVLTEKQERESVADDHVRVRAADILAQRLPSVPDKPATDGTPTRVAQGASEASAGANTATKPPGAPGSNGAGSVKSASGSTPAKSTTVPVQPGKTAAQTSAAQKPKPVNKPSTDAKPEGAQGQPATQPSIVEQKPAPVAAQPDTPPPSPDSSPQ
jgi:rod shape-determining protein MreC